MRSEKQQETTALQRFGRVCGWLGNGLGGLLIIISSLVVASALLIEPKVGELSYRYSFSDGKSYEAIGHPYWTEREALKAIRQFRGEQLATWDRPYGTWKVFRIDNMTLDQTQALNQVRARAIEQAKQEKAQSTLQDARVFAILAIPLGLLLILFGQILRYIFAGSRRSK